MKSQCMYWYVLALLICSVTIASGQTTATSILRGTITDTKGAPIQDATVVLTRVATGQELKTKTDEAGRYSFFALPPDIHRVGVRVSGFKPVEVEAHTELSKETTIHVRLELGELVPATIQISAGIESQLATSDASIGSVFREETLKKLPTQERQPSALFFLQPATSEAGEFAGSRQDQVTITLDGIDVSDKQTGSPTRTIAPVTIESLKEMRVAIANANATFLPASGGQIVLITKSGGKKLHGSAYLYHQNDALAANSWTNNRTGISRPYLLDNRFGLSLGGPLYKDRTFFFLNYEGRRNPDSATISRIVPTAEYRRGILRTTANGVITTIDLKQTDPRGLGPNPKMLEYLSLYPLPNDFSRGDRLNTAGFTFAAPTRLSNNISIARLDHKFSERWNLSAKVAADRRLQGCQIFTQATSNNCQADLQTQTSGNRSAERPRNVAGSLVSVFSEHLTNESRFSWLQDRQNYDVIPQKPFVGLDIPIRLQSFYNLDNLVDPDYASRIKNDTYQLTDTLTWAKGPHNIQTGLNIRRLRAEQIGRTGFSGSLPYAEIRGFSGSTPTARLANTLFGILDTVRVAAFYDGDLQRQPAGAETFTSHRYNEWSFFFSDTWKLKPSLTITYGASYGWQSSPVENTGRESLALYKDTRQIVGFKEYLDQRRRAAENGSTFTPEIEYASLSQLGRKNAFNTDYSNLSPRLSVAWNPSFSKGLLGRLLGNQKTVIRGGYSLVFDRTNNLTVLGAPFLDNGFVRGTFVSEPLNASAQPFRIGIDGKTPLPTLPNSIGQPENESGALVFRIDPFVKVPRNHNVTFSLQRALFANWMVETGYVGRIARQLYVDGDLAAFPFMHKDMKSGQTVAEAFDAVATALRAGRAVSPQPYFENYYGTGMTTCFAQRYGRYFRNGIIGNLFSQVLDTGGGPFVCGGKPAPPLTNYSLPDPLNSYLYRHSAGFSNYHAFFISLRKRASNGLSFEFNYALSKSLDNMPDGVFLTGVTGAGNQNTLLQLQSPFFPDIDYAPSGFDARHSLNAHGVYELPFGKTDRLKAQSRALNTIISGWFAGGIFTARSGRPLGVLLASASGTGSFGGGKWGYTWARPTQNSLYDPKVHKGVTGGANGVGSAGDPRQGGTGLNLFADPAAVESNFREILVSRDRRHGRGALRGLGQWNFDWSLGKETRLTSRVRFSLTFDFFNVFNHVNFADPVLDKANTFRPDLFGVLNDQLNRPRRIQIGGRFEF